MKQHLNNIELLAKIKDGDEAAKNIFVENNQLLVHSIVNRFPQQRVAREDLFQIGCVGLMKAINKFDVSFNVQFSTYAVPIILGEIKRFFRDDGSIRIARSLKEGYVEMVKSKEKLYQKLNREPTYADIANDTNKSIEDIILAFEAHQFIYSLNEPVNENDSNSILLEDKVRDQNFRDIPMHLSLKDEVSRLQQREKLLLYYRFDLGLKQAEVAKKLNISQVQVSRLEKKIIDILKERLLINC